LVAVAVGREVPPVMEAAVLVVREVSLKIIRSSFRLNPIQLLLELAEREAPEIIPVLLVVIQCSQAIQLLAGGTGAKIMGMEVTVGPEVERVALKLTAAELVHPGKAVVEVVIMLLKRTSEELAAAALGLLAQIPQLLRLVQGVMVRHPLFLVHL